jgi:palmitoyltransferase ZDHHC13/17
MPGTYYTILGVAADADEKEIGDSFMEKAIELHPDVVNTSVTLDYQQETFKKLCLAYACLSDMVSRQEYDALNTHDQEFVSSKLFLFRVGSEKDISENEACSVWEIFCISRGLVCNKVLREYVSKLESQKKNKSKNRTEMSDDEGEMIDVTYTPDKLSNRDKNPEKLKPNLSIEDLIRAVKFSLRVEVTRILFHYPDLCNALDNNGYSPVHWAAKSGDGAILQTLHINGAKLNIKSESENPMMPIHWAASDGKTETIKYLLDNQVSINTQDGNGCTPVVIAAQHDRHNCCIFLIKSGADMTLRDNNGDTALHWAAYKGFAQLAGLLSHLCPNAINQADDFGQTPLHLATLRGNVETLEYLVINCGADTSIKDKNNVNPLELAIRKKQLKCEWALRTQASSSKLELIQGLEVKRLLDTRVLQNIFLASNDREMALWPWRVVCSSNFVGTLISLAFMFHETMSDLWLLHMINTGVQSLWWFCYWMCLDEGSLARVIDEPSAENPNIGMYDEALNIIGSNPSEAERLSLCHTCHVVRPLRSKHCQNQRCCINKFDHYCPFVYNTVSRDNYKYFMGVVCLHAALSVFFLITAMFYCQRASPGFKLYMFIFYFGIWCLAIASLVQYHMTIIVKNLTTNEHINMGKYKHFMDNRNTFDNPFDLGNPKLNIWDGLFPSSVQVYTRDQAKDEQYRKLHGRTRGTDREALLSSAV